jgi:iduronate 2-sulfatase
MPPIDLAMRVPLLDQRQPGHPPNYDEPRSWSQTQAYWPSTNSGCKSTRFCPDGDSPEAHFSDVNVTSHALDTLAANAADFKARGANFALFLGLHFPHQPWYTPAWAVKPYMPIADVAPAMHTASPTGGCALGLNAELDGNPNLGIDQDTIDAIGQADSHPPGISGLAQYDCPWPGNNSVPVWMQKQLRAGYYSAVTHTDRLFGNVMTALDESGVAEDTFVLVTVSAGHTAAHIVQHTLGHMETRSRHFCVPALFCVALVFVRIPEL